MFITGFAPASVSTVREFALGSRGVDHRGREYIYLKGVTATITASSAVIVHDTGEAEMITTTTGAAGTGNGKQVAVSPTAAVAVASFFWGCIYAPGVAPVGVRLATDCAKYTRLHTTATAGVLDDAVVNAGTLHGIVSIATITTAAVANCSVNYPTVVLDTNGA